MAPNLRQNTALPESFAKLGQLVRNKVPATTVTSRSVAASYWDWPTDNDKAYGAEESDVDLFSADHLETNLIKDAATASKVAAWSSGTVPEHDDYWAEQTSVHKPLHHHGDDVDDSYWNEASHQDDASHAKEAYWEDNNCRHHKGLPTDMSTNEYWQEISHESTAVDNYWNNDDHTPKDASFSYWQELSYTMTESERYWSMTVVAR